MMIAKECFLPHAKPENGVLCPDYQFVLIRNKLKLSNGENMQMLIALAPSKENQHVEWLLNVNSTLLGDEMVGKMAAIETPTEFYTLMKDSFGNID